MSLQLFKEALNAAASMYVKDKLVDHTKLEYEKALIEYEQSKKDSHEKAKELFLTLKICADDIIVCEGIAYKLHKIDSAYRFLGKVPNTVNIDKLPDTFI